MRSLHLPRRLDRTPRKLPPPPPKAIPRIVQRNPIDPPNRVVVGTHLRPPLKRPHHRLIHRLTRKVMVSQNHRQRPIHPLPRLAVEDAEVHRLYGHQLPRLHNILHPPARHIRTQTGSISDHSFRSSLCVVIRAPLAKARWRIGEQLPANHENLFVCRMMPRPAQPPGTSARRRRAPPNRLPSVTHLSTARMRRRRQNEGSRAITRRF